MSALVKIGEPEISGLVRIEQRFTLADGGSRSVNSYLLYGSGRAMIIDTGWMDDSFVRQVKQAWRLAGEPSVETILLTHGHKDHIGNVTALTQEFAVKSVLVHQAELESIRVQASGLSALGALNDDESLETPLGAAIIHHSPGHSPGSVCLYFPSIRLLVSGDSVLSESSTLIAAPGGNMGAYLASLRILIKLEVESLVPGHGPVITNGGQRVLDVFEHRVRRAGEVLGLIRAGVGTEEGITRRLYGEGFRRRLGERMTDSYLGYFEGEGVICRAEGSWVLCKGR